MEYFIVILAVGTVAVAFHAGLSRGRAEVLKQQTRRLHERFAVGSSDPFRQTYGLAGLYMADINAALLRVPLVVIQASDFMDLVARRRAGADASSLELEQIKDKLTDDYLLNKGMSPSTLAAIKRL